MRRRQVEPYVRPGSVLVDLGCGHRAETLAHFAPRLERGIGFDMSVGEPPAPNVELVQQAADVPLPLEDATADVVCSLAVLEHVGRPDVLLAEGRRLLKPGGTLVVTTPAVHAERILKVISWLRLIDPAEIEDHERYYAPGTLRDVFVEAGFDPDRVRVRAFELGLNLLAVAQR